MSKKLNCYTTRSRNFAYKQGVEAIKTFKKIQIKTWVSAVKIRKVAATPWHDDGDRCDSTAPAHKRSRPSSPSRRAGMDPIQRGLLQDHPGSAEVDPAGKFDLSLNRCVSGANRSTPEWMACHLRWYYYLRDRTCWCLFLARNDFHKQFFVVLVVLVHRLGSCVTSKAVRAILPVIGFRIRE